MHERRKENPVIGITCGDLNGIGLEVTIKALLDYRILKRLTPVMLCSSRVLSYYRRLLKLEHFNFQPNHISKLNRQKVNVFNVWEEKIEVSPGTPSKELGKYTRMSLQKGVELLKSGHLSGLVTAPLHKNSVQDDSFRFPGHTEYLANAFGEEDSLMFMISESLRVGVVTGHIPVGDISKSITKERVIKKADIMINSLKKDFGIGKPVLAILGLNPHAGDGGLLGKEDEDIIQPAIEELKEQGHVVFGAFSADGFFGSGQYANFDAVLAMYHDQGLIPFKQMAFGKGVNFTAGLPVVRTSPDHGTAFPLAGKNLASPTSMLNALFSACDIWKNRKEYA